jgi:DNA (cytosine-5)-methyltransferase 1
LENALKISSDIVVREKSSNIGRHSAKIRQLSLSLESSTIRVTTAPIRREVITNIKRDFFRTIDLFAGCGGMSLGFQNAGFDIVAAFDDWEPAIDVYRNNFKHPIYQRDLKDTSNLTDICSYKPNVIIGGPPCQDFSGAGHRNENLGRADLTVSYMKIVESIRPTYFVMENVPRIQKSSIYAMIKERFKSLRYGLTETVLDASRCGVPQQRKRLFLLGELGGNDAFLSAQLAVRLSKKHTTLFDYFGHSLGFEYYFRVPRSYTRRGIFSIYEPAMTIRGVDRPVPKGYPSHPADPVPLDDSIRTLTFKERSLIQTFPEDFLFDGTKTALNQMIGNAVPVKLAGFIASTLRDYIEQKNK